LLDHLRPFSLPVFACFLCLEECFLSEHIDLNLNCFIAQLLLNKGVTNLIQVQIWNMKRPSSEPEATSFPSGENFACQTLSS